MYEPSVVTAFGVCSVAALGFWFLGSYWSPVELEELSLTL